MLNESQRADVDQPRTVSRRGFLKGGFKSALAVTLIAEGITSTACETPSAVNKYNIDTQGKNPVDKLFEDFNDLSITVIGLRPASLMIKPSTPWIIDNASLQPGNPFDKNSATLTVLTDEEFSADNPGENWQGMVLIFDNMGNLEQNPQVIELKHIPAENLIPLSNLNPSDTRRSTFLINMYNNTYDSDQRSIQDAIRSDGASVVLQKVDGNKVIPDSRLMFFIKSDSPQYPANKIRTI